MNRLITSTAIPARELKIEALASMSASFERLCLAAGLEALGEMMEVEREQRAVLAMGVARIGRRIAGARRRARSVSTAARWRSRVRGFVASTARSRPFPVGKGR
jgi:hypothetical protein